MTIISRINKISKKHVQLSEMLIEVKFKRDQSQRDIRHRKEEHRDRA